MKGARLLLASGLGRNALKQGGQAYLSVVKWKILKGAEK